MPVAIIVHGGAWDIPPELHADHLAGCTAAAEAGWAILAAGGPAVDYLNTRAWGNDTVNALLSWMSDNQATGADGAAHFLKTQPDLWTTWVSPEVAEKVKASL